MICWELMSSSSLPSSSFKINIKVSLNTMEYSKSSYGLNVMRLIDSIKCGIEFEDARVNIWNCQLWQSACFKWHIEHLSIVVSLYSEIHLEQICNCFGIEFKYMSNCHGLPFGIDCHFKIPTVNSFGAEISTQTHTHPHTRLTSSRLVNKTITISIYRHVNKHCLLYASNFTINFYS